jgi:steroid delta-isomerase-like uncharacterized protein
MASHAEAIRTAVDAWNDHDRERYIAAYRADVGLHGFPEGVVDAASLGDFFAGMWAAVPDACVSLDDVVAQDDRAAVRLTLSGTHEGELMGVPASHQPLTFAVISILRFDEDGRIAERWNVADFLTMLQQMGAIPAPA